MWVQGSGLFSFSRAHGEVTCHTHVADSILPCDETKKPFNKYALTSPIEMNIQQRQMCGTIATHTPHRIESASYAVPACAGHFPSPLILQVALIRRVRANQAGEERQAFLARREGNLACLDPACTLQGCIESTSTRGGRCGRHVRSERLIGSWAGQFST